jgi:hypothetical protein
VLDLALKLLSAGCTVFVFCRQGPRPRTLK